MSTRYQVRELYATVPTELREDILKAYQSHGVQLFLFNPDRIRNLERAMAANELLGHAHDERVRTSLVRAYRLNSEEDKALALATESLKRSWNDPSIFAITHLEDVCWMQRRRGESTKTLQDLDRRLKSAPRASSRDLFYVQVLLVEKARTLIALERRDEAEKLLTEMTGQPQPINLHALCSAYLVLGFLHDRRGDTDGAKEVWHRGLFKNWQNDESEPPNRSYFTSLGVNILLSQLIMASLCDELDDNLAEQIHKRLTATLTEPTQAQFVASLGTPTGEYRKMWLTPRGRDWARRIAFRDLSFAEYVQIPVLLAMHQGLRDLTFATEPTAEQDDLLWTFCQDLHAGYSRGDVGMAEVLQLVLTWKGTTNVLGWSGVAPKLSKSLRAEAAYFAAIRYQRLNRPTDAADFLRTAVQDTDDQSAIGRLVRAAQRSE